MMSTSTDNLPPDSLLGMFLNGRYRITGIIGEGGMGRVYEGWDDNLRRKVAIKVPKESAVQNTEFMRRFEREAMTMAQVQHENIVTVYDSYVARGPNEVTFIAMERVSGMELDDYAEAEEKNLKVRDVVDVVLQLAEGLDAAHRRGVIHRDIKPENLIVTKPRRIPKIMDFGIARVEMGGDNERTATYEKVPFTPMYASPEQWRRAFSPPEKAREIDIGVASDVYSFTITVYKLFGRSLPFDAKSVLEWGLAHRRQDPLPIRRRNSKWPRSLDPVFLKGLEKEPEKRYQTATEFARALEQALAKDLRKPWANYFPAKGASTFGGTTPLDAAPQLSADETEMAPVEGTQPDAGRTTGAPRQRKELSARALVLIAVAVFLAVVVVGSLVPVLPHRGGRASLATVLTSGLASTPRLAVEVASTAGPATSVEPVVFSVLFSHEPLEFGASLVRAENGVVESVEPAGDGLSWRVSVTPAGEPGEPRTVDGIRVVVGEVEAAAGPDSIRPLATFTSDPVRFDSEGPTGSLALANPPRSGVTSEREVMVVASFSEPIEMPKETAIEITGGALRSFVRTSDTRFEILVSATPLGTGEVVRDVTLRLAEVSDMAGNPMPDSAVVSWQFDDQRPVITMTTEDFPMDEGRTRRTDLDTVRVDLVLSEPTTRELQGSDLRVTGARVISLAKTGALRYTATLAAEGRGVVSVGLVGGSLCDAAGNCAESQAGLSWLYEPRRDQPGDVSPAPTPSPTPVATPRPTVPDPAPSPRQPDPTPTPVMPGKF